jgi:hypothetical protein
MPEFISPTHYDNYDYTYVRFFIQKYRPAAWGDV